ncbi:MAG: putative toxin-antitoxin system toxin component, PIN family [Prevotella sp.]|nr:putative toxin-antitoxin system toxin component, PIN family [Prevotella sp.]
MKVIIDTNIWVSFLIGHQSQLLRRILTDLRFDVYVCERLVEEILDVASRDKIRKHVSKSDVGDLMDIIHAFCQSVPVETSASPSSIRDPKDLYLLSFAETIGADYIVSGDADLTDLGQHKQTKIIKLSDFKAMMLY